MEHFPYVTGYSPIRWQAGINAFIEKKAGVFMVDKLRTILLFEADFHMNNKKLGRDSQRHAEELNVLADEQFGSRKRMAPPDQSLNRRLLHEIHRQRCQPYAVCSNDAKSCYDRIVHSIASLSMQRVGVPIPPIVCMFVTLQNLRHYVRSVYGQ